VVKVGFLVNPIAGMGGSVGLKGTDGSLLYEALKRGAKAVAPLKTLRFLKKLAEQNFECSFIVANGVMGCQYFEEVLKEGFKVSYTCLDYPRHNVTTREDTLEVCKEFLKRGVDLIVFVGGDGTARDVAEVVKGKVPILGIPAGVKMYSGVFAVSPEAAVEILSSYVMGFARVDLAEVADVDESSLQSGTLKVRVFCLSPIPVVEGYVAPSKDFGSYEEDKIGIAKYFIEDFMDRNTLYLLGPGTTIKSITDLLGLEKTLLGVDALYNGRIVGRDLSEGEILKLLKEYGKASIVVSVIGRQGYVFGRGNQQFTPQVLKLVDLNNIFILSSPEKLRSLKYLLVDTGDSELDIRLSGYRRVITGYKEETLKLILPACCLEKFRGFIS